MSVNVRATLATLFTLTAVAVGQAPDETGSIRGRIVRAGTTESLSKAVVELVPAGVGSLSDFDTTVVGLGERQTTYSGAYYER